MLRRLAMVVGLYMYKVVYVEEDVCDVYGRVCMVAAEQSKRNLLSLNRYF